MLNHKTRLVLEMVALFSAMAISAAPVKHPNLLLNPDEIAQVKMKIAKYPWAADALLKTKEHALNGPSWENNTIAQALYYAFTGNNFALNPGAPPSGSGR